jgi:hypothetical protein
MPEEIFDNQELWRPLIPLLPELLNAVDLLCDALERELWRRCQKQATDVWLGQGRFRKLG